MLLDLTSLISVPTRSPSFSLSLSLSPFFPSLTLSISQTGKQENCGNSVKHQESRIQIPRAGYCHCIDTRGREIRIRQLKEVCCIYCHLLCDYFSSPPTISHFPQSSSPVPSKPYSKLYSSFHSCMCREILRSKKETGYTTPQMAMGGTET